MRHWLFPTALGAFLLLTVWAHSALDRATSPPPVPAAPRRIVSLAPSVTETLYALGLGQNVAGVTEYCGYPPEVKQKPRVAGFSNINFEAVLRVRPDLVVAPIDKISGKVRLERLGLPVLLIDTRTLSGLMDAIPQLGKSMNREQEAAAILRDITTALADAKERARGKAKPRVLFSVMHSYEGLGYISEINIIGRDGFYNELIEAAGGVNAYQGDLPFPLLSREAIIFLNPDVVIDVIPNCEDVESIRRDWEGLSSVAAVRNKRLHLLTDEAHTVPGPRFHQTLTRLSKAFHPE